MATGNRLQAGTSDPLDFRNARAVGSPSGGAHGLYGGNLATEKPGSSFSVAGGALTAEIAIAGALLVRLRGLFATAGGTLSFKYLRPASLRPASSAAAGYAYAASVVTPHADVSVTGDAEFSVDIEPGGESDLLVTFTPGGTGVVTFFDVMQQ